MNISNSGDAILFPQMTSQLTSGTVFHSVRIINGPKDSSCLIVSSENIQCSLGSILLKGDTAQIDVTFTPGHVTGNATFSAIIGSGAMTEDNENCSSITSMAIMSNVDLQLHGYVIYYLL